MSRSGPLRNARPPSACARLAVRVRLREPVFSAAAGEQELALQLLARCTVLEAGIRRITSAVSGRETEGRGVDLGS